MKVALRLVLVAAAFLLVRPGAHAHPGDDHPPGMRVWKDAEGLFEIEAAFVVARDGKVQLWKHDGSRVWIPLERLSQADRQWVKKKLDEIEVLNRPKEVPGEQRSSLAADPAEAAPEKQRSDSLGAPLSAVARLVVLVAVAVALKRSRAVLLPVLACVAVAAYVACPRNNDQVAEKGSTRGIPPAMSKHFEAFKDKLALRWDEDYLYVGSNGLPDHRMMVGIKAWQQQVPLPQPYTGKNAWQIPLKPVLAQKPISAKKALYRGAIALAVNGVPIFNALNNRGEDAYLAGELDEFGGHCGRGDDYHYHIAPVHLEKLAGKGKPIAYALDGFPLHGYTDADGKEPDDLDEFNGRMEKDGYRYYSTKKYPYINGGMRGVVTVRGDQIEPQPRDSPIRPAGRPLRGAKITDFVRDEKENTSTLKYDLRGKTHSVKCVENKDGSYTFTFTDAEGKTTEETYRRRERNDRPR